MPPIQRVVLRVSETGLARLRSLEKVINIKHSTLKFSGIAMGLYALVTAIESVGLWYERT